MALTIKLLVIEVVVIGILIIQHLSVLLPKLVMNIMMFGSSMLTFEHFLTAQEATCIWKDLAIIFLHQQGIYKCKTEYGSVGHGELVATE
jgi:hypothetical protein